MKKFIIPLMLSLICAPAFTQNDPVKASVEYARQGIRQYEEGNYSEAIVLFRKGRALDPRNTLFTYEIALCYYVTEDYPACISALDSVIRLPKVNDQFYQLLGDAWDMSGRPDSAMAVFTRGLKLFPSSGALLMESGLVESKRLNHQKAYSFWLRGAQADPGYPENYYYLCQHFRDSSNKIPLLLYGEVFLNLQQHTTRTADIQKLLCATYMEGMKRDADSNLIFSFMGENDFRRLIPADTASGLYSSLILAFRKAMNEKVNSDRETPGVAEIADFRKKVLVAWLLSKYRARYPSDLFLYQAAITEAGYFDAYSHWILMKCNVVEFQMWQSEHGNEYQKFAEWYRRNPLKMKTTFILN